ncbi:PLP-dependent aminotransferase family protein [Agrilactobacillus fermenti]|uniref:aminotransferase-like domain-containing protein n=1 Tax=Agrilactobacillus fermenti TaxID=2586909 RepID=UPI003A5C241D
MEKRLARRVSRTAQSGLGNVFAASNPNLISFAAGFPAEDLFPKAALKKAFSDIFDRPGNDTLQYHDSLGLKSLREKIARHLNQTGTPAHADQLMLTQGAQQGIDLVARLVLDPGDGLAVEAPTYIGALASFDAYEPTYYEIPVAADGLDTTQLQKTLLQHDIKLLYTIPDYQNPTGTVMSLSKRQTLIQLAERYNFIILEDSPYRDLTYDQHTLPSLKSLDTNGRVINLGSFSKILAPGLRLGWLTAETELFDNLVELKAGSDVETSSVIMQGVNTYLDQNDLDAHIQVIRDSYTQKMNAMLTALQQEMPNQIHYNTPTGGFFIWLTAPTQIDMGQLLIKRMMPEGNVSYVPAKNLFPSKQHNNAARLNFTGQSIPNIYEGIHRMATILRSELTHVEQPMYAAFNR